MGVGWKRLSPACAQRRTIGPGRTLRVTARVKPSRPTGRCAPCYVRERESEWGKPPFMRCRDGNQVRLLPQGLESIWGRSRVRVVWNVTQKDHLQVVSEAAMPFCHVRMHRSPTCSTDNLWNLFFNVAEILCNERHPKFLIGFALPYHFLASLFNPYLNWLLRRKQWPSHANSLSLLLTAYFSTASDTLSFIVISAAARRREKRLLVAVSRLASRFMTTAVPDGPMTSNRKKFSAQQKIKSDRERSRKGEKMVYLTALISIYKQREIESREHLLKIGYMYIVQYWCLWIARCETPVDKLPVNSLSYTGLEIKRQVWSKRGKYM